MSETEVQQLTFSDLAEGLSDQVKAEFYKTLHEAGIGPKDTELARLLRALQLYRAYYESIPLAIEKATDKVERVKQEIKTLAAEARKSSDAGIELSRTVIEKAEKFTEELAGIDVRVEAALDQSAGELAVHISELLNAAVDEKILEPIGQRLTELADSNKAFGDVIAQNKKASEMLCRSIVLARRAHFGSYALGGLLIIVAFALGSWFYIHHWYEGQVEEVRASLVSQVDKNRALLLDLSKSNRTLQLLDDPDHPHRKLLVLKDQSGWQSARKYGVIEFQE